MVGWMLLLAWIIAHALQFRWAYLAMQRASTDAAPSRHTALQFSLLASCASLLTLAAFLWVFVIGGSSNVAQMAGPAGLKLWSFWFEAWPFMLLANPLALIFLLVAACCPPYPPRHAHSFGSRVCAFVAGAIACYVVVTCFPDA